MKSKQPPQRYARPGRTLFGVVKCAVRWFFWTALLMVAVAAAGLAGLYIHISKDLPVIESLADYRPPTITMVYADDGRKIAEFYKERRIVTPLEDMPETLKQAFIAAEDARFYKHQGIDIYGILRALIKNIEAGAIVQGGSTITQQVTKSFFLSPERSYRRKIKEAILAYRIDKNFTKDEILFLYLNQIYLGHGAYGVAAAAENYFGKSLNELTLAQCAALAGLPQAPSRYSPVRFPDRTKQRQIYVLNRMVAQGYITNLQASEAIDQPLGLIDKRDWFNEQVPAYTEHVRRYVEDRYGVDALYRDGLKIFTAVNIDMQIAGRQAVERGLRELDKRQGWRGPIEHLEADQIDAFMPPPKTIADAPLLIADQIVTAVVIQVDNRNKQVTVRLPGAIGVISLKTMRWARKPDAEAAYYESGIQRPSQALRSGDVIWVRLIDPLPLRKSKKQGPTIARWRVALEQTPQAEAALLCIEAQTGQVKAMVGGRDFESSQFNRAIQSRRQPGSAFKPIIYAAALEKGFTPASVIIDSPIVYQDTLNDSTWKPKNYGEKFYGPTLMRQALAKSRNVVTIKILQKIGIDYAIDYARKFGFTTQMNRDLSLALGASGASLLEIVSAYSIFCNAGYLIDPIFITEILDRNGQILERNQPRKEKVIDAGTAYLITSMLESVITQGTGRRARALNRPAAGKTGTTNNLFDAWFIGYTPGYVSGAWVGFDMARSLGKGETGSRAASPIWLYFMQQILADKPVQVFQAPESVVFAKIDAETGLLPIAQSAKVIDECFKEGTVPTTYTQAPDAIVEEDDFFKAVLE